MASCAVSDPKPTCGVITSPPIRGQNVTLSCTMTYRVLTETRKMELESELSVPINWESAAGTFLSKSSTNVTNSYGQKVGETRLVKVTQLASEAEIPSYNCTAMISFNYGTDNVFNFALNNLTWTCVSAPVFTWCMYFIFRCILLSLRD